MATIQDHPNFAAIETERTAVFARLNLVAADMLSRRGHYIQLLISPEANRDGTSRAAFTTRQVPDEDEGWPSIPEAVSGLRCQYFLHRHDHPNRSRGYSLGCRVVWNGQEFVYLAPGGASGRWAEVVTE